MTLYHDPKEGVAKKVNQPFQHHSIELLMELENFVYEGGDFIKGQGKLEHQKPCRKANRISVKVSERSFPIQWKRRKLTLLPKS